MYWFKSNCRILLALIIIPGACLTACRPDVKETGAISKYFDIEGFFTADTARLNHLNNLVLKTVTHNGITESKKVKIGNWGREFDLFINSDINKPAWKDSYRVITSDSSVIYEATVPELKMREMVIKKINGKVKWILIYNRTKNSLYQTTEKLSYFPDSLYVIEKSQKVRIMGANYYKIKGLIGQNRD